ncbi:hypothetical protein XENOCAPTIV_022140 [Xenoophorus captivus]|uniref:Uncharacterized protein n=1 Tax=Xenoophorus captivus TaxID=1517983 RepID=A0ABV0RB65_9TELE
MHAPGYPKSLPYLHTQTHTDKTLTYQNPALQTNVCTVVVCMQTHTHYCRKLGHSLKREDLCACTERKGVWQVIWLKKTSNVRCKLLKKETTMENKVLHQHER